MRLGCMHSDGEKTAHRKLYKAMYARVCMDVRETEHTLTVVRAKHPAECSRTHTGKHYARPSYS